MQLLTFEDWLNDDEFWSQKDRWENFVLNDSENYKNLVPFFLAEDELNKIFEAQHLTYKYIIDRTLAENEGGFLIELTQSPFPKEIIYSSIKTLEHYAKQVPEIYTDIVGEKTFNDMPYGAKFLLPVHYKKMINAEHINGYFLQTSKHSMINMDGNVNKIQLPSVRQMKYIETAINVKWIRRLQELVYKSE